jgi:alkylation response protein AidB-like acyl-CoA dehydrogenase
VTATAQQVHGATGFALESGLHRYYRRAKSLEIWNAALCSVVAGETP